MLKTDFRPVLNGSGVGVEMKFYFGDWNGCQFFVGLHGKRKLGIVKRIQKQIDKFGLTNEDVVFTTV